MSNASENADDLNQLSRLISQHAYSLGFSHCGISNTDLSAHEADYFNWIGLGYHGTMDYMEKHGTKRTRPTELIPGTQSVISVLMPYFEYEQHHPITQLQSSQQAYISRYALGRDYHKVLRKKLAKLAEYILTLEPQAALRGFVDSAPVLERQLAHKAGLGFLGKNSLLIHPKAGSWFFIGEIYTNLILPTHTRSVKDGCGSCQACIQECPTQAIVADGVVDARRCISYLTIEHPGPIDEVLRPLMGNRIYGCDDCQLVCPWNHFTPPNQQVDFKVRHQLDQASLIELFSWTEAEFEQNTAGSPIRRIGYEKWQRNIATALGNAQFDVDIVTLLEKNLGKVSEMVDQHINWALQQQLNKQKPEVKDQNLQKPGRPFHAAKYYLPKAIKTTTQTGFLDRPE
ncbi:iron-sulfur cluster binding protein [Thiomicrospira aerophila AL3]|uniref:Epoxyqueuosine reductase n=1 Tax=Thiomicrospira aerophila AL3 TaxID=717772 RepID=W0DWA1_9GAMM|nr:iron-sulfur cluster binding protein [Thiomicrospira aerophila AL3]